MPRSVAGVTARHVIPSSAELTLQTRPVKLQMPGYSTANSQSRQDSACDKYDI